MIPVKIECECGQHYAFEVEPVNGRMPSAIVCPGCGGDGTVAANDVISVALTGIPVAENPKAIAPSPPVPNLHLAASYAAPESIPASIAPAPAQSGLHLSGGSRLALPEASSAPASSTEAIRAMGAMHAERFGLVSREQAETEARAKVSWGEAPDEVIKYLMMQSFTYEEAKTLVDYLMKGRLVEVRKKGIRNVFQGLAMMCVPFVALYLNMAMISIIIMGGCFGVGVWGFFKVVIGIMTIAAPKMESGDVAEG